MTRPARLVTNGLPAYRDRAWLRATTRRGQERRRHRLRGGLQLPHRPKVAGDPRSAVLAGGALSVPNAVEQGQVVGIGSSLAHSPAHLAAIRRARSGRRSNFWRGGVTAERASIAAWTTAHAASVHAQYDYTCQSCGDRGGRLHAHHIVPVWADPVRARDIGNLIERSAMAAIVRSIARATRNWPSARRTPTVSVLRSTCPPRTAEAGS